MFAIWFKIFSICPFKMQNFLTFTGTKYFLCGVCVCVCVCVCMSVCCDRLTLKKKPLEFPGGLGVKYSAFPLRLRSLLWCVYDLWPGKLHVA